MPLHDHPNMCVFFRMLFGKLNVKCYDKTEEKFKYNNFSSDEYMELLESKKRITAKLVNQTTISGDQFMLVRPSANNMHEFVAQENTCFFDICLPNYTTDSLRRITYFKETGEPDYANGLTELEYYTTPPKLPVNFEVHELSYRGYYY
jgi:hypothetical protein